MEILNLKDIVRKDVPIYYRRHYESTAVLKIAAASGEYRVNFTIEQQPTGKKLIKITLVDTIDYPLIPLIKELKEYICNLDTNGGLPD